MNKPAPRELEVIRSTYITPYMLRITLGGAGLAGFPVDQESAYIKLLFPQAGERPLMRTYTIRQQRDDETKDKSNQVYTSRESFVHCLKIFCQVII